MNPHLKMSMGDVPLTQMFAKPTGHGANPSPSEGSQANAASAGLLPGLVGANSTTRQMLLTAHRSGQRQSERPYLYRPCFTPIPGRPKVTLDQEVYETFIDNLSATDARIIGKHGTDYLPTPDNPAVYIAQTTAIEVGGTKLNANRLHLDDDEGKPLAQHCAIACGYPAKEAGEMEKFFQMILDEEPSVGVVLTESHEAGQLRDEYFKHDGQYGDIKVKVNKITPIVQNEPNALCFKRYDLTVEKHGKSINYSVIHVENWKDGFGVPHEALVPVLNEMRQIESENPASSKPRVPLAHCMAGVGRTGQLLGAYMLAFNSDVHSIESMIHAFRKSRCIYMVYAPAQKEVLANIGAARGIPIAGPEIEDVMVGNLRHIGYGDIGADVNEPFFAALTGINCHLEKQAFDPSDAARILADPRYNTGDIVLAIANNAGVWHETLWSDTHPGEGRNITTGETFRGTPLDYWNHHVASGRMTCIKLGWVKVCPSAMSGDLGIYMGRSGKDTHNAISQYLLNWEDHDELELSIGEAQDFLRKEGLDPYYGEYNMEELADERDSFLKDLHNTDNLMLDFFEKKYGQRFRLHFKNLSQTEPGAPITGLQYTRSGTAQSIPFPSIGHVLDNIINGGQTQNPVDKPMLCVMSDKEFVEFDQKYASSESHSDEESETEEMEE